MLYLDHQASTPLHPAAMAALQASVAEHYANPHAGDHTAAWAAADAVEAARGEVAFSIGADPDEIIFTSGATESNNIALLGIVPRDGRRRKVVVSAIEHKAVLGPARELSRRGYELVVAPVTRFGIIDLDRLSELVDAETLLVSCMAVNNEIGTVQPVAGVASLCEQAGALLHVDAAQALAWNHVDVAAWRADFVSLSAHKAGGPKGVGALYLRRERRRNVQPLFFGGEQEDGLRPGTLPTALCVSFGSACANLPSAAEVNGWRARTRAFERSLLNTIDATVNGASEARHPGAISLTIKGIDAETLIIRLQPNIALARGSACTSGTPEPSHVLRALGLDLSSCESTIRISSGRLTTADELDEALRAITDLVGRLLQEK